MTILTDDGIRFLIDCTRLQIAKHESDIQLLRDTEAWLESELASRSSSPEKKPTPDVEVTDLRPRRGQTVSISQVPRSVAQSIAGLQTTTIAERASEILRDSPPKTTKEIFDRMGQAGYKFGGQNPTATLHTVLSRHKKLFARTKDRRWRLK